MKSEELEQVYRAYYHEVYLYALSLCVDTYEAEELASDTFYKALLSLEEGNGTVKYWLFKVCRNLFLDGVRRRKRQGEILEGRNEGWSADTTWERMLKNEEARRLYRVILKLPEKAREIVLMFYFMNYSIKEIGSLTGQPTGAVKTALCRARARLRQLMEEELR